MNSSRGDRVRQPDKGGRTKHRRSRKGAASLVLLYLLGQLGDIERDRKCRRTARPDPDAGLAEAGEFISVGQACRHLFHGPSSRGPVGTEEASRLYDEEDQTS